MVSFGHRTGAFVLQYGAEMGEHLGRRGVVPAVVGLDRVGIEVVELPLVGQRVGAVFLAAGAG